MTEKKLSNSSTFVLIFIGGVFFAAFMFVSLYLFLGPFAGLSETAPKNATQTVEVVTQNAEISKIASILLTVEGILLGFSTVLFDKLKRTKLGAFAVTVTAIALVFSLLTVLFADTNAFPGVIAWSYFYDILLFIGVATMYILSAWYLAFRGEAEPKTGWSGQASTPPVAPPSPPVPPPATSPQPTTAGTPLNFEKEKVGMFWDFKKSLLIAAFGFYLSAYVVLIVNLDRIVSSVELRLPVAVVLLIVVLYSIINTLKGFEKASIQVSALIRRVESGEQLGDLTQLLDIKVPSILGALRLMFTRISLKDLVLETATVIDEYSGMLHLRNNGGKEVRIIAYSLDGSEIVYMAPSSVIAPHSPGDLRVTPNISLTVRLDSTLTHTVTVWTETGLSRSFHFNFA